MLSVKPNIYFVFGKAYLINFQKTKPLGKIWLMNDEFKYICMQCCWKKILCFVNNFGFSEEIKVNSIKKAHFIISKYKAIGKKYGRVSVSLHIGKNRSFVLKTPW